MPKGGGSDGAKGGGNRRDENTMGVRDIMVHGWRRLLRRCALAAAWMAVCGGAAAQSFLFTAPSGQLLMATVVGGVAEVSMPPSGVVAGALVIPAQVAGGGGVYAVGRIGAFGGTAVTSVAMPAGARTIAAGAFSGCRGLEAVSMGDSLQAVGASAFCRCTSLRRVVLPAGVADIGDSAFLGCSALADTVVIPDGVGRMGRRAFSQCRRLRVAHIGGGVEVVADECFAYCDSLQTVVLGQRVDSVGRGAFYGCGQLDSVALPAGLRYIGYGAFEGCSALAAVVLGDSVEAVGRFAFSECAGLRRVVVGRSVASIGRYAFNRCRALETVCLLPAVPPVVEENAFANVSAGVVMEVDCGLAAVYAEAWGRDFAWHEPEAGVVLTVVVDDTARGRAAVVDGVRCDSTAVVAAEACRGFVFDRWSNGSTANPDTLRLQGDSVVAALFEVGVYGVEARAADSTTGWVEGGGCYAFGSEAVLRAVAAEGFVFDGWNDGVGDNPRRVVVEQDTLFVALFVPAEGMAVADEGAGVVCRGERQCIVVEGAEGLPLRVVNGGGRVVYATGRAACSERVAIGVAGVYVVEVGRRGRFRVAAGY